MKIKLHQLNDAEFRNKIEPEVRETLMRFPENSDIYSMLAVILGFKNEFDEALKLMDIAIGLEPTRVGPYITKAAILLQAAKTDEAFKLLNYCRTISKRIPSVHWNHALVSLQNKLFAQGWSDYRWRKTLKLSITRVLDIPELTREINTEGKTVLVWTEQGLGDQLMFYRFVNRLAERNITTNYIVEVSDEIYTLLAKNNKYSNVKVVCRDKDGNLPYDYDYNISIVDLPDYLGCEKEEDHYLLQEDILVADNSIRDGWKKHIEGMKELKIGLCWKGSKEHANDYNRSMGLIDFEPLKDCGIFFAVQVGTDPEEVPEGLDLKFASEGLVNMEYTTALLQELDVLITVDTSVAHLGGCIGIPTFLLLPKANEWRWANGEGSSYWYPSITMFKQKEFKDWSYPLNEVKKCLTQFGQRIAI